MSSPTPAANVTADVHAALTEAGFAPRAVSQCGQCGQFDTHPKVWFFGDDTPRHHDCLSVQQRQDAVESNTVTAAIVEACEGGLRGADLEQFISDNVTSEV